MRIVIISFLILSALFSAAQKSKTRQFFSLSGPEKRWVLFHPFIATKAHSISSLALEYTARHKNDQGLDGDPHDGMLDAFRHAFWMAMLVQEIPERKARSLGNAHEKGNKRDYRRKRLEEGVLPDEKSSEMDYLNNEIGIRLGKENIGATADSIAFIIRKETIQGHLWKLKKDFNGNYTDCQGNLLSAEELQSWKNNKCLVPSNYQFKYSD